MRWFAAVLVACFLIIAGYVGSAVISLGRIVSAVRSADGAAVLERTNLPRIRHALVDQMLDVYLEEQGRKRKLSPFQRMAVNAYGASIADGVVAKLVTPSNLTALLRRGTVLDATGEGLPSGMSPLGDLDVKHTISLLSRFEFVKPVEFSIKLGSADDESAISLHFEDWRWVISGVKLPTKTVKEIVRKLPSL